jgi:hypothetical protein
MRNLLTKLEGRTCVILDMEDMNYLDVTGAEILNEEAGTLQRRGIEVLLARPAPAVRLRLTTLGADEFPAIAACPIFDTLEAAMRHADRTVEAHGLCDRCRPEGHCLALAQAIEPTTPAATHGVAGESTPSRPADR